MVASKEDMQKYVQATVASMKDEIMAAMGMVLKEVRGHKVEQDATQEVPMKTLTPTPAPTPSSLRSLSFDKGDEKSEDKGEHESTPNKLVRFLTHGLS